MLRDVRVDLLARHETKQLLKPIHTRVAHQPQLPSLLDDLRGILASLVVLRGLVRHKKITGPNITPEQRQVQSLRAQICVRSFVFRPGPR